MIDSERLLDTFLTLVQIDSPSGHESAVAAQLAQRLRRLDMQVLVDQAGNVLGRWDGRDAPLLLSAHMDTVAPGVGIKPVVRDGVVCSDGTTILGGDDKSGIAIILEVLNVLHAQGNRPALEVALSVGEETGLLGAKAMDREWFRSSEALVLDSGGELNEIVRAAPSSDKFTAVVRGRAAHAGANPEDGINAIAIASQAIAHMPLGRIDDETTANIGMIRGGEAVNVVPDWVQIRGEARSHSVSKLDAQIATMRSALQQAVAGHQGARLELEIARTYQSYNLAEDTPIIQSVTAALKTLDETPPPVLRRTGGGSDANIYNARGIVALPVSTGMQAVHTNGECIALRDMVRCAELILYIVMQREGR
jgi:tripeptide aminopeptidase